MNKAKAIASLVIIVILILLLLLFTIPLNGQPSFQIGNSDYDFYWISSAIDLGLDLKGGIYAVYRADLDEFEGDPDRATLAIEGVITNLSQMLAQKGYTEATVTREGTNNIRVEVPNVTDTEELMKLLGEPASLIMADYTGKEWIYGKSHIKDAYVSMQDGKYVIALEFNDAGAEVFSEATKVISGYSSGNNTLSMIIEKDGERTTISSPTVSTQITGGAATIQGNFDYQSAYELATQIKAGSWATTLTLIQSEQISATLGESALLYTIIAGAIGLVLIIILMIVIYKGLGLASSVALVLYTLLLIFFLAVVPWVQLTLEGIAGVILSIGMAVDANVIIFERIKDEKYKGRGMSSAVKTGFRDALAPIIDGNVTTIIGSIVMIIFGNSAIQSFALVLLIGIILSMFTCLVISRLLVYSFLELNENENFYGLGFKPVKKLDLAKEVK